MKHTAELRPKPPTGRKRKWTPRKLRKYLRLVRKHGAVSPAAEIVGIAGGTARETLHRGRNLIDAYGDEQPSPQHADRFPTWFARITMEKLALWETQRLAAISNADASGKRPAAGAMWRLERANPSEYGPPVQITVEAEGAAALAQWARDMRRTDALPSSPDVSQGEPASQSTIPKTDESGAGAGGSNNGLTSMHGGIEGDGEVGDEAVEVEWVEVDD